MTDKAVDKPKRGRPPKAAKHAKVAKVLGPLGAEALFKGLRGEDAMPHEVVLEGDIEDRFKTIDSMVKQRFKEVMENASKDVSESASTWTPWLTAETPEDHVEGFARRLHLNERVLHHMLGEVAMHMVLSMKIESQMKQARRSAIDRALKVPKVLQEFIVRLHAAGLMTASVKDMPASSIEALVALLNGNVDQELIDAVGIGRSGRRITAEEAERALQESERLLAEHRDMMVEVVDAQVPMVIEPVVPEGFGDVWDYANGPLPPEYWSTVQTLPIPYVWEYRMAVGDEEDRVLGMALPEAHSWSALCDWDRQFKELAFNPIRNKRGASNNIRDLMAAKLEIDPEDVDSNLVRTWLLLLAARLMTVEECDRLFDPDFFEGIVMPCPATGAGVVRQLVRKGD